MRQYDEAIRYLYGARLFGMKLGLENIRYLLKESGNPENAFFTIHIAGTNGKGSVAAMVASVLYTAGFRTGLFTSPHISSFRERIRINNEMIAPAEVVKLVDALMPVVDSMKDSRGLAHPTFYELVTAMAVRYFAEKGVRFAVIETGLGGRLDATNAIPAKISAITSIGLEHQQYLGDTIEKIAAEKAGIMKEGSISILAEQSPEAMMVLEKAAAGMKVRIVRVGKDVVWADRVPGVTTQTASVQTKTRNYKDLECPLLGRHQANNLCTAIGAIEALGNWGFDVPEADVRKGISAAYWPARFEVVRGNPNFVLDAAANPHAAGTLAETVKEWTNPGSPLMLVLGMLKGKNHRHTAEILAPLADEIIITEPDSDRAQPASMLFEEIQQPALRSQTHIIPSLSKALSFASEKMKDRNGSVLITGSLYLMAGAREFLGLAQSERDFSLTDILTDGHKETV